MLAKLGHKVMRLKRVALGRVRLGRLGAGKSRPLKHEELAGLRKDAAGARREGRKVRVGGASDEGRQRRGRPPAAHPRGQRREKKKPR